MFGSPLLSLRKVLVTKSTIGLISFPVTIVSFIASGLWTMYGFILQDYFMVVPNLLGAMLCVLQLLVLFAFNRTLNGVPATKIKMDPFHNK